MSTDRASKRPRMAEVLLTGVGGQGIQLVSSTLALAAVAEGRHAMMVGNYGGMIRGGMTEGTVVVGVGGLRSLPIIPSAWSGFVMSPEFWGTIAGRIRAGGPVAYNSSLATREWADEVAAGGHVTFPVAADEIARELDSPLSASFVLLGAFAAITGLAGPDALVEAMAEQVPSYRSKSITANEAAIVRGFELGPAMAAPAFPESATVGAS